MVVQRFFNRRRKIQVEHFQQRLLEKPPLVSVIIPAHNEAESILATLNSLLRQTYPNLELIVVDDGSSDNTRGVCRPLSKAGKIKYLRNELRGGKSSAINLGLYHSRGDYILTIDADTVFDREAVLNILLGFADPRVGAVSGNIRVSNARQNLLTRLQAAYYLIIVSTERMTIARLDMLMIVSGAFGIYRRELVEATGGWDAGPGEDVDLTLKGRKWGARVAFSPQAVCWTKVPATISAFVKQQLRWERSLVFYYLRKHNSFLNPFKPGFRPRSFLGAIDILFWQVIMAYSFIFYLGWLLIYYPDLAGFILLTSYLFYLAVNSGQFLVAWLFSDYKKQDLSLFLYLPLYGLFSAYFLRFVRAWAYTQEICWRRSQRDPHVPPKVRKRMVRW